MSRRRPRSALRPVRGPAHSTIIAWLGRGACVLGLMAVTASWLPAQTPPQRVTREPHATSVRQAAGLTSVRFTASGRALATGALDGRVCLWQLPTLTRRWCAAHGAEVYAIRISADDRVVWSTGGDAHVVQWDARTGARLGRTRLPHRAVTMAWAGDTLLVVPTVEGEVVFVSPGTGRARVAWRTDKEILAAAVSPDGVWLATGPSLEEHRLHDGSRRRSLRAHAQGSLAYHPRGVALGTAEWVAGARVLQLGDSVTVRGLALPTLQEFGGLSGDTATVNMPSADVAFSADGRLLLVAGTDGGLWQWQLDTEGRPVPPATRWQAHHGTVTSVDQSPEGEWIATVGLDGRLRVWRGR